MRLDPVDPPATEPPFEQLRRQIAARVGSGELPAGTRLPTVRALAAEVGLAVNTVARVYRELEADGVVVTEGRRGTFVSPSAAAAGQRRAGRRGGVRRGRAARRPRRHRGRSAWSDSTGPATPEGDGSDGLRSALGQPALTKPAFSAASSVVNQTSAMVWSYHWESGVWYLPESLLPLIVNSSDGAAPSSSASATSSPNSRSANAATEVSSAASSDGLLGADVGRLGPR